jgi:hypothetical protein
MNTLPWPIEKIIEVAICLKNTGSSGASTSEIIAAAFVLNRQDLLPATDSDLVEAWERLGNWQHTVKLIKRDYRHLIEAG